MQLAVSGISGFTGGQLQKYFEDKGHTVVGIPRYLTQNDSHLPELAEIISRSDVVMNLSGAPIISRHTGKQQKIIRESRIHTTRMLVRAMTVSSRKPFLFISASAVGFYKPGLKHDEFSFVPDTGFLGQLCTEWELEAQKASEHNIRTVILRSGIILGKEGGVVKRLLPLFRMGLGATILPASSSFPWIHAADFCAVCAHFIQNQSSQGAYNIVVNTLTTQKEFAKAFAASVKRPLFLILPGFVLKLFFGKGAEIITNTPFVVPERLIRENFVYKYNNISDALNDIVNQYQQKNQD